MSKLVKNVFNWDHFHIYLCGPIDFTADGGRNYRLEWTDGLVDIGLSRRQILSPTNKPLAGTHFHLDDEAEIMRQHRASHDYDGLCNIMSQIVHIDLRLVDKSDIVLARFPTYTDTLGHEHRVPTYGTMHEIVVARQQKKPVFVVWEGGGKQTCSAWLMWLVGHQRVFGSFEELKTQLKLMSEGKEAVDICDWLFLDLDKNH